jgi:hypothetical protein
VNSILKDCKVTRVLNSVVAGTSDQDGTVLDMTGFDNVMFVAALGDVTSGSVLELQVFGNTASSTSSPTPVELTNDSAGPNTAGASDNDNKLYIVDVQRPAYQYVFPRVKRGTANAVIDGVFAIQYKAESVPQVQGSTVFASALLAAAA